MRARWAKLPINRHKNIRNRKSLNVCQKIGIKQTSSKPYAYIHLRAIENERPTNQPTDRSTHCQCTKSKHNWKELMSVIINGQIDTCTVKLLANVNDANRICRSFFPSYFIWTLFGFLFYCKMNIWSCLKTHDIK